jgi:phage recombination protein Bet
MPSLPPKEKDPVAALPLGQQPNSKPETAIAKADGSVAAEVLKRGISEAQWNTLRRSLFPGAAPESVLLVWDYCLARRLDPMKRPCHIVPMEVTVKTPAGERKEWRDVVLPGIYELRTTAQRTGEYRGHDKPELGPMRKQHGVEAPEWCAFTAYRGERGGEQDPYPVVVYFREVVATKRDGDANARWRRAPIQMLTKCAEAAALREAFPDELGGQMTEEEMEGQRHPDLERVPVDPGIPRPDGFDEWVEILKNAAGTGSQAFAKAWQEAATKDMRAYLTRTDPEYYESLKNTADDVDIAREDAAKAAEPKGGN